MEGGAGSILGVVMGSFFMAMISNGMTLIKIDAYWQQLVIGLVVIFNFVLWEYLETVSVPA